MADNSHIRYLSQPTCLDPLAAPTNHASRAVPERSPKRSRRNFTAADKLRILTAAKACTGRGELAALLRREGIYGSHLNSWERQLQRHGSEGLSAARRGRKPKLDPKDRRIQELERTAARLERELLISQKLIELQKHARRARAALSDASERREHLLELAEQLDGTLPVTRACTALGLSRATLYRHTSPSKPPNPRLERAAPRKLDEQKRQAIIEVLRSPEFVGRSPHEIHAVLRSRGVQLASIRTMYRLLATFGEKRERRGRHRCVTEPLHDTPARAEPEPASSRA